MGLDQYAYTRKNGDETTEVEFAYWRKHNALQGWMENLWIHKGNTGIFNGVYVILTLEDLECLEQDLHNEALPETDGFFYGSDSRFDDRQNLKTLKFIFEAKKAIKNGLEVVYCSSW